MDKTVPLVSIIIPAYNASGHITDTLVSVQRQNYSNWECIIVNDGSTDHTEQIVHQFIKNDTRFFYLKDIILYWESKMSIPAHTYFFSSNIFKEKGIRFDEQIKTCEDIDCWIRVFQLKPYVLFIPEKLAYYRVTPGSMSKITEKVWK